MQSPEEGGRITIEIQSQEDNVKVIFSQGETKQEYIVDDELFKSSQLNENMRNIHAVIEALIQLNGYEVNKNLPRKKQLQEYIKYLSDSPVEEFREFASILNTFFIDEYKIYVLSVIIIVIIILACYFYSR